MHGGERGWWHRGPGRVVRWACRPGGLVAQTRWLFTLCFLIALAVCLPHPLLAGHRAAVVMLVAAAVALTLSWIHRYRTGQAPLAHDVTDAAAIAAFAAACPEPSIALGFVLSSVWGRALYGSAARLALALGATLVGMTAALPLWALVPGHSGTADASPVIGAFPVMTLTTVVARNLAVSLFARERAQYRDAALAGLGARLLAASDRHTIYEHAWSTAHAICAASPGLRMAVLRADPRETVLLRRTPGLERLPESLPPFTAPPDDGAAVDDEGRLVPAVTATGAAPPFDRSVLERTTGFRAEWRMMPIPGYARTWVLLGRPRRLPRDAVVAVQSLINQMGLALRNTAVREDLTTQATTDHLTGLANRTAFREAVASALRAGAATAVLFVDLDDFKNVNDELGHGAGDDLLQHVATRLRRYTRPHDLCARLGGDEFAVLLTRGTDDADADDIAARVVAALSSPVIVQGRRTRIGASVGIAVAGDGSTCDDLIHRADLAMYSAKTAGKNCARRFDPARSWPVPADPEPRFGT